MPNNASVVYRPTRSRRIVDTVTVWIIVRSKHYQIKSGSISLVRIDGPEPASVLLVGSYVRDNQFTVEVKERGTYHAYITGCVVEHIPSHERGKICLVAPLWLNIGEREMQAGSASLPIDQSRFYYLVLARGGHPWRHGRCRLAGESVTVDAETDDQGRLALIEDPRGLLAIEIPDDVSASVVVFDEAGSASVTSMA